ncbi:cytochrome b/b6 domain-containing protein [Ferrovibrio terrae]|uniref:cytochrome b/b6 domain-containing protein n=1 Tax=Ferrovibrio terrae TaxID=2594003 RepID=UPI003137AAC2
MSDTLSRHHPVDSSGQAERPVWDFVVRLFHWTVVAGCLINFVIDDGKLVHRWVGYTIAGALVIRILWGFVGSRHARFRDFIPSWTRLRRYGLAALAFREPRHVGHNPLGAVMILALMALLALIALSGWMTTWDIFTRAKWLEEVHEAFANLLLPLVAVHVAGVLYGSLRHGENLVKAMITGRKRAGGNQA